MKNMNKAKRNADVKKFGWNMIGSMSNALASFVLLTMVTRMNGSSDGGIFSLAFSTAQMLTSIGCFETRAIQVTDVKRKLEFKDYFTFRFASSIIMMLCLIVYIVFAKKSAEAAVMFFICLYKAIDCMSDSFQGLFQLENRIDLSGMALGIRVILSTIFFGITLGLFHNLVFSAITMCVVELVFIFFFDYRLSKRYEKCKLEIRWEKWKELFRQSFPLFIGSFMLSYMVNASKYAIDANMSNEIQNYYGFLLMPAFVINLFSLFGFRPMLTPMANYWEQKNKKEFTKIITRSIAWILFLTVGAVIGAYLLGIWFLNLVSGLDLNAYRIELVIVMLGGSMNAIITVCYYVLTVMRKQMLILAGYGVGFLFALIVPSFFVRAYGLTGAVVSYVIPMTMTVVAFGIFITYNMKRANWTKDN